MAFWWFSRLQRLMYRIALAEARLEEVRNAVAHCPAMSECGYVRDRMRELELTLRKLREDLDRLKPSKSKEGD